MACIYKVTLAHQIDACIGVGGSPGMGLLAWSGGTGKIAFTEDQYGYITGVTNSGTTKFMFQAQHPGKAFANAKGDLTEDRLGGGYLSEGSLYFKKNDWALRKKVTDITNTQCLVIVKLNNGTYQLFGTEYGCFWTPDMQSGAALKDPNGTTMTFRSESTYLPKFMDPTLAEALFDYDTTLTA